MENSGDQTGNLPIKTYFSFHWARFPFLFFWTELLPFFFFPSPPPFKPNHHHHLIVIIFSCLSSASSSSLGRSSSRAAAEADDSNSKGSPEDLHFRRVSGGLVTVQSS